MIGFIKGKVIDYDESTVLLENNGIGYEITCSQQAYSALIEKGFGEVYTYLAVKEDDVSLYGFISREEKNMFLKLISVSGIGPKMGITILSSIDLSTLAVKIATSDVKGLAKVKGLGKKTAERIIVELREKMNVDISQQETDIIGKKDTAVNTPFKLTQEDEDIMIALMSLGLSRSECLQGLKTAKENNVVGLENVMRFVLQNVR